MSFDYFQIKNINAANSSCWKYKRKNGVICLVSILSYWIMVLKLSTKVHFLEFGADLSQKPKSIKAIYIYTSESSYYSLSENDMVYGGWSHRSWDINNLNIKKDAESAEI